MIPSDLATRLRLLSETVVQPVQPAHEIASDLPEFSLGQRFTARIEAALPDGTFRAVVAGKSLTLSLPQSAQAGDTLDLVVADRSPRLIVAHRAADTLPQPSPATTLSRTGQLISTLLSNAQGTPQAAPLARAAPLLTQPPTEASALASALKQAVAESGLFYEAHQAQWVAGRYSLEALVREPQGRHSRALRAAGTPPAAGQSAAPAEPMHPGSRAAESKAAAASPVSLPVDLQPLVHQQLDTAATQQLVWQGEIWPGQTLRWEIADETPQREAAAEAEPAQWSTTLRLVLPALGEVAAALRLTPAGVSLALTAGEGAAARTLRVGQPDLTGALAAAGVPLLAMSVTSDEIA